MRLGMRVRTRVHVRVGVRMCVLVRGRALITPSTIVLNTRCPPPVYHPQGGRVGATTENEAPNICLGL